MQLAFGSYVRDGWKIFVRSTTGDAPARPMIDLDDVSAYPSDWSASGYFVFEALDVDSGLDIWAVAVDREGNLAGEPFAVLETPAREENARVSADGRWLVYTSDETGRPEIYVTSFPEAAGKWQVSRSGGVEPRWRPDGKAVIYRGLANNLQEVDVDISGGFRVGKSRTLFEVVLTPEVDYASYDVSPDGNTFLVNTIAEEQARVPLTVLMGW